MTKQNIGKALTWNELAEEYHRITGRYAQSVRMETIFAWAKAQKTEYYVDSKEGTIHKILPDENPDRPLDEHEFNGWNEDPGLY